MFEKEIRNLVHGTNNYIDVRCESVFVNLRVNMGFRSIIIPAYLAVEFRYC